MQKVCLYLFILIASISTSRSQDIYSGGIGNGFSFQEAGWGIYAGGNADGVTSATSVEVPLPITLIDFTARLHGSQVLLKWQTATESNSDHFEVQHAANATSFSFLTNVAAAGNSTFRQDYSTIDPSPYTGLNYYRLKQVDQDGKSEYSKIVHVTMPLPDAASLHVYPNPASKEIKLVVVSLQNESVPVSLYSATGKLIRSQHCSLSKGANQFIWDVSHLSAGGYCFSIGNGNKQKISFIKQ
jgi:hypothetical protein